MHSPSQDPDRRPDQIVRRVSRACLHCRQRKSRCDLDSNGNPGKPPCQRCVREHRECILGGSNRGGRRIRKNKIKNFTPAQHTTKAISNTPPSKESDEISSPNDSVSNNALSASYPGPVVFLTPNPTGATTTHAVDDDEASMDSVPRNPSDAWQRLTDIATHNAPAIVHYTESARLIVRYEENFHPYLPLVPRKYFDRAALDEFAANEKFLLTAILTIASKDLVDRPEIHECSSKYMLNLITDVSAGAECDVDAVEAFLLLAEWEPQGLRSHIERVGRGEEDRAAWMHVGLALRSGYFMGLDRTSFRGDPHGDQVTEARRRLAWASCYVCDRLISDFPSLQPTKDGEEDYSKIFQAMLDLTQLYGNVHEVLYSGMRTSNQMMLMGDYVKYVDDFRLAILRWKSLWGPLNCSPAMRATLNLSYEYLRLYTTAFAFQAAISQSLVKPKTEGISQREQLRTTFKNVASMQDARFIYESVDAAKAYLTILVDSVDPERHLHFMPLRFYLYGIYSAVFLYKARSFGMMVPSEEAKVQGLVARTMEVLKQASAGPNDVGARYSRLLELLWKPKAATSAEMPQNADYSMQTTLPDPVTDASYMEFSPANDFSWLDLEAVGDYVSGDQISGGLLGLDTFQNPSDPYQTAPDRSQSWQPPTWLGDMSSNLLF
ncbi:Transcription factor [Penicillium chermesinum]|nr:Transcription factor [Penicillium chermesinum]